MKRLPDKWNLNFFEDSEKSVKEEQKEIEKLVNHFVNKWKPQITNFQNPEILKGALFDLHKIQKQFGSTSSAGYFYWLKSTKDQEDSVVTGKLNSVTDFSVKMANSLEFFIQAVSKIPEDKHKEILESELIKPYRYYLERIFKSAKFILSEPEENLFNLLSSPAREDWINMTSRLLSSEKRVALGEDGKKSEKSFAEMLSLIDSKKKKVRDMAAVRLNEIFERYAPVAEAELNAILKEKKVSDDLRGYKYSDEARFLVDDVDREIIETLIKTVEKNFSISREYYALKAKLAGVPKLAYHERNFEYGAIKGKFSYAEGVKITRESLAKLDSEFVDIFNDFTDGHIDVYPKKGKDDGAFCAYGSPDHPVYMLLNYTDRLQDILTLAHETGHGIHYELMRKKQNAFYFSTSLATAEVASTFMEDFVFEEVLKNIKNDDERLSLMMMKLNRDISTIFRQIASVLFERELHKSFREKGYLSKEEIGVIFSKHMKNYMGTAVSEDKGSNNWWVYWGHLRRFFYNYSYAHGLIVSKSLQAEIRKNPEFIHKIKEFMASGASDSPHVIFKNIGVDVSHPDFWKNGILETRRLLFEAEKLAKQLKKI